ncbi:NAD(P)/FAD-dependent oxidoreductase [Bathymodiolus septemdierum thioautotrophic gill symbiont]|uniref:Glycine oxidase n=1 Tax=endosymbiont of Bathymodiolus septemdierum str. Myojin knoll TaxID=1303921 RepID=A0A0P0UR50_9GAMM|nr:FAD-dependent oxidoreductase [Bathymodiolus septemdierum thioautotrophic gill symbiont]BAS67526.1 glycine oxidase [endosymbiont of Bathymodiolus septemdierum str. Myojin knoll]
MSDCIIIGGGVIGMMSARTLAMSGASVRLIDQRACGKESSWAGGGIISPLYPWMYSDMVNELSMASQVVYEELCATLLEETGIDTEYVRSGLLMMDEYDRYEAIDWMAVHKVHAEKHPKGTLFTDVAQVRNPRLLRALKADILKRGVEIVEFTKVDELIVENNTVLGVKTENKAYYADNTVICGGAWSSELLEAKNEMYPVKGQMIVIRSKPDTLAHIVLDKGRYLIPRKDGRILIGSTTENVGFDRSLSDEVGLELLRFATERFPELQGASIEHHWSGFRPASKSGVVIKKDEKLDGLFINTGHLRNGLNMAPESAKRIAELIKKC